MSLLQQLRPHWRPLLASALLIGLGLTGSLLHGLSSLENQRAQLDHYGQALARSTAQRAVDATLSQDMISLQAVLQELTRHPQVVGATLHDVENHLMVQSGFAPADAEPGQFMRYSATVAVDADVAGHLQLALTPPSLKESDLRFFALWLGIIAIAALLPWFPQVRPYLRLKGADDSAVSLEPAPEPEADEGPMAPGCILRLRLTLANLPQLSRQLNWESFEQQLGRFEQQLRSVLSLYGGERLALSENTLLIDFKGENESDSAFRALCGAQLLGELTHLNPGPRLRLTARIHALPEPDVQPPSLAEEFALQYQPPRELDYLGIEIDPALIDAELLQHLELDTDTGALIGIKPPYRQLLNKQQQQLQAFAQSR